VPTSAMVEATAAILRKGDIGAPGCWFVWMHEEHRPRS
jgi:hypothetical protein